MNKEEKLKGILDQLETLKADYETVVDEYENDYAEDGVINLLVEASNAFDDAIDCIWEVLE